MKIFFRAIIIGIVGVFVIDYLSHLLFSDPMETSPYFFIKTMAYFLFSILFLFFIKLDKHEFIKILIGGIIVSLLWGAYYNVLPSLFDYYPSGISLAGLSFLGMGILGTGLAFEIVHTLAFIGGYYSAKKIIR